MKRIVRRAWFYVAGLAAASLALFAVPAAAQQAASPAPQPAATAQAAPPATPLPRDAGGQIQSTETRDWSKIDRDGDHLISPGEMQAYLDASKR